MKILFVTVAPVEQGPAGLTSFLASARYRAIIPAEQLSRRGHEVHLRSVGENEWTRDIVDFPCDVLVVSKSLVRANERLVEEMKARGVKVIVDICDNVFKDWKYGEHFNAMARLADVVTSSTDAMAGVIRRETGRDSVVITDPVEGPRGRPRYAPRLPAIRMLWFGNPPNIEGISKCVDQLMEFCQVIPVRLTLVTLPWPEVKAFADQLQAQQPSRLVVDLVPWSLETTWRALEECDIVWIPAGPGEFHLTKSPNRLVETLWAGRFAVVDSIPSYLPFASAVPVGKRLGDAILESFGDTAAVEERIADAQWRISHLHSPYACGLAWAEVLGDSERHPLRLNLACRDRIVDGYVNVDASHSGAAPRHDVTCDLGDLEPFADDSAEEVLSVRGIERFRRGEVADVLREWLRVLKPGGRMIIECGDLASTCRALVESSGQDAETDSVPHRTLSALFGDPAVEDPIAVRRWAYTPESLSALLAEVGLVDIRREPPQFQTGEPRAMRVVGIKRDH